jgi:hypothetical protein
MIKDKFNSIKNIFLLKISIQMKRILGALLLLFIINACDDGDLKVDVIDFSDVSAQKCSDKYVVYKTKEAEMLILAVPQEVYDEIFKNDETLTDSPREVAISSTNQVVYRQYNGAVSSENICPTIPAATPNLLEEWIATSGTIQITTTSIKTIDANNATRITGYKHNIVFKNITFQKPNGSQTYETYIFGDYTTSVSPLAFGFDEEMDKSTCDNRVFDFSGGEAFILDVSTNFPTLFQNVATTTPRIEYISATNKLTYKLYSNTVSDAYFCTTPLPATPILLQEWNAINGVTDVSGIIEVTTSEVIGTGFQHTIRLKKVTLARGNSNFSLGDDYLLGSFVTN